VAGRRRAEKMNIRRDETQLGAVNSSTRVFSGCRVTSPSEPQINTSITRACYQTGCTTIVFVVAVWLIIRFLLPAFQYKAAFHESVVYHHALLLSLLCSK